MSENAYKDAGVDIDAANTGLKKVKKHAKTTFNKYTLSDIGSFGGCFSFPKDEFNDPVLVSSVDGVGTKLLLANLSDKHDTVGQCLVNHCVNDILVIGAKPLFFLDYFAAGKLDNEILDSVIRGFSIACKENNCVLIGGETAEMPGFYDNKKYDISGTIVGVVEKEKMLSNKKVSKGDILIGISTSGNSKNIINAFNVAKNKGITTIGMTGEKGNMIELSDYSLNVPSTDTPRIQESHIMLGHIICELIEKKMFIWKYTLI